MSSERDRQILRAREIDKMSTVMITFGVNVVKKNPIKVGAYVVGLLLCLFFNVCSMNKEEMEEAKKFYTVLQVQEQQSTATAKSKLGVGVGETRDLFWRRFSQGKGFAARQTKWDALFLGISAMGRDEGLILNMLFNFTIGLIGAVVTFIFSLVGVIRSYQASIFLGLSFFALASLAAVAFVLSWLIGLYFATAGVVYVSAVVMSNNLRIGAGDEQGRRRVN
eukprot:gene29639-38763_t